MWRASQEIIMSDNATSTTPPVNSMSNRASLVGFLAMCFIITGLVGLFASYAAPLPLERAIAREKTLDEAEAALTSPDPQAAIAALKDRLDDSAKALIPLPANAHAAIQAERVAMRARFLADSEEANTRMHWLIIVVTVMSAIFGTAITGMGRRG